MLAESEGFEPSDPLTRVTGLANLGHKPLGQLSFDWYRHPVSIRGLRVHNPAFYR